MNLFQTYLTVLTFYYQESIKGVLQGSDEAAAVAAQNVLHHCLDAGLCLLSPFMPYLSEELYQRLPRRPGDNYESVCVAAYPTPEKVLQSMCNMFYLFVCFCLFNDKY